MNCYYEMPNEKLRLGGKVSSFAAIYLTAYRRRPTRALPRFNWTLRRLSKHTGAHRETLPSLPVEQTRGPVGSSRQELLSSLI